MSETQTQPAVTHQMANDLAEMGRKLRTIEDQIHELAGGNGSLTRDEYVAYSAITDATAALARAVASITAILAETGTAPTHDGGPDIADGAPTDGVVEVVL